MKRLNKIVEDLKRLFIPHYTDKKVQAIHEETEKSLTETAEVSKRYNALLKKNGVTMRIAIVAGHAERVRHT